MDEGRGVLHWGVDQHCSYAVGTGHLQSLVSREEKLEKQATRSTAVTPLTEGLSSVRHKDGAQGEQLWIMERGFYEEQQVGNRTEEHNGIKEH